jgi:hypothetical protein
MVQRFAAFKILWPFALASFLSGTFDPSKPFLNYRVRRVCGVSDGGVRKRRPRFQCEGL